MVSNYLKMAWRTIRKQKGYSLINLFGLAIGMACCLLILLFVQDELSFDRHHEKADRIYRLIIDGEVGGSLSHFALAPFAAPPAFAAEIPEVESYVRILRIGRRQAIIVDERSFEETGIFLADESFFKIFTHKFLNGDPETVLNEPGSVVITRDTALRLFGDEDPMGKTMTFGPVGDLHVTGVIENVPRNSHFSFNHIISFQTLNQQQQQALNQWLSIQGWGYLLLRDGADPDDVQSKFEAIVEKSTGEQAKKFGISIQYFLQKMMDIHLRSKLQGEIGRTGDIVYVYIFSAIALFILFIACINFMNLSTARSAIRAREVGLRKVFGAYKKNLIVQFLTESILISLAALILAVLLASLALPVFNSFSGKEMSFDAFVRGEIIAGMLILIVFTGFLSGSYPAFFLSNFQPISVLRGRFSQGAKSSAFRKVLVVFQFTISIALIVGTGIVLKHIDFMKKKDLGFNREQLMVVSVQSPTTIQNFNSVKSELKQNPNILDVSFSSGVPGRGGELRLFLPEGASESETHAMRVLRCDHDFLKTYQIPILDGRDFSREFTTDATEAFIINETAARKFGWIDDAVGKQLTFVAVRPGKVLAVVKDFHFESVQQVIEPAVLMLEEQALAFASIRLNPMNVASAVDFVKETWEKSEPEREFDFFFMEDELAAQYSDEERLSDILSFFALLAIFIACLGLFGLASFTAEQRTKEIGIRKVLGASVKNIIFNLSKEFVKWVLIANVIAWPAAYFIMNNYWLSNFPYRNSPSVITFLTAGAASVMIALLTVSAQVFKAALSNPVESLRYE